MKTNERSELLLGKKALETLNDKTVLVVGVGGVGSFCVGLSKNWGRSFNSNR